MGRSALFATLLMLGACAPTFKAPPEVREAAMKQLTSAGLDAEASFTAKGFITTGYLTGNNAPDILVDYEVAPAGAYCGTGGCPLEIWVKDRDGPYRKAFDRQLLGHGIQSKGGRVWLAADVHGVHCGGAGADPCAYAFAWRKGDDRSPGYFGATSIAGVTDAYESPLLQALPFDFETAPIEITSTMERFEHNCARAKGEGDASDAVSYGPDLTGDGRRELIFDGRYTTCRMRDDSPVAPICFADTCGTIVFVAPTLPNAPWIKAFSSIDPVDFDYDYSTGAARFRLVTPCDAATCAKTPLDWSAERQRLE
ncbi:MAG: hypothetical protein SGJ23_07310 [Alphaproteobacteria bacterium]|nr:hypothetical protein [Alphaproteobacteria bacterium]